MHVASPPRSIALAWWEKRYLIQISTVAEAVCQRMPWRPWGTSRGRRFGYSLSRKAKAGRHRLICMRMLQLEELVCPATSHHARGPTTNLMVHHEMVVVGGWCWLLLQLAGVVSVRSGEWWWPSTNSSRILYECTTE